MTLKKNDVVEFTDNNKVLILDLLNFMNRDFVFVNEILADESEITNKYKVMVVDYNKNTLQKVTNLEILAMILPKFEQRFKLNFN